MRKPHLKPSRLAAAAAVAAASVAGTAWALSFGPVRTIATMGQPLDASVELQLQPGEVPAENCVSAQVNAGDNPLPASQVSAVLVPGSDGSARVRVRTTGVIEEPFLSLTVSVGCDVRFARQFTIFADPPSMGAVLSAQPGRDIGVSQPVSQSQAAPTPATPATPVAATAGRPAAASTAPRSSTGEVRRVARNDSPTRPVPAAPQRERAAAVATTQPVAPSAAEASGTVSEQRVSTGTVSRGEGVARLKLDTPTVTSSTKQDALKIASQQRDEAMATAKIAVDVAEVANASVAQKIIEMEAQLAAARKELAEVQAALARIQAQRVATAPAASAPALASSAAPSEEPWYADKTLWLAGACAGLLLLCSALYLRLRRGEGDRLEGWNADPHSATRFSEFDTVGPSSEQFALSEYATAPSTIFAPAPTGSNTGAAASDSPSKTGASTSRSVAGVNSGLADLPTLPAALSPAVAPPAPKVAAPTTMSDASLSTSFDLNPISRFGEVSIEELLDVEQQAEFFVVLGQDDAAVELLTNHVLASGGASPMPFLKLLEIFRRTGDQSSYERTRKRFNARFNGVAPEWGADPNAGRGLVDYPDVLARIERSWSNPVDAMAELQTLMFRNDANLLFELPAYRDIMMLFTLAREHHEGKAMDGVPVDVLLPLNSESARPLPSLPALADLPAMPAAKAPQAPPASGKSESDALDDNLRMTLEDPSATVQVSMRRR